MKSLAKGALIRTEQKIEQSTKKKCTQLRTTG